jgi:hypothetical protein
MQEDLHPREVVVSVLTYSSIKRVMEYELDLPQGRKIHNVFHVSCLKRVIGKHILPIEELPLLDEDGKLKLIPEEIL